MSHAGVFHIRVKNQVTAAKLMFSTYLLRIWLVESSYRYVTWVIREVTCILHYMDVWLSWKRWHVPCMGISLFLHIDRNFGTRVPNKLGSVSHNITVMAPGYLEKGLCQARFGTQVKLGNLTRTSPPYKTPHSKGSLAPNLMAYLCF
jgi:hypothetical protein